MKKKIELTEKFSEIQGYRVKQRGGKYFRKTKGFVAKDWDDDRLRAKSVWKGIKTRAYGLTTDPRRGCYNDCSICEDWEIFENFYTWWKVQYKESGWQIDKDILCRGNKIYSPSHCCLVPRQINVLLTKSNAIRGSLPIGVSKAGKKFKSYINKFGEKIHLGTYDTPEEAFKIYKAAKEDHIKHLACVVYGDVLREDVKASLFSYEVNIGD